MRQRAYIWTVSKLAILHTMQARGASLTETAAALHTSPLVVRRQLDDEAAARAAMARLRPSSYSLNFARTAALVREGAAKREAKQ